MSRGNCHQYSTIDLCHDYIIDTLVLDVIPETHRTHYLISMFILCSAMNGFLILQLSITDEGHPITLQEYVIHGQSKIEQAT